MKCGICGKEMEYYMDNYFCPNGCCTTLLNIPREPVNINSNGKVYIEPSEYETQLIKMSSEDIKVNIWGYELCNGAQWEDFLNVVNKLGEENKSLRTSGNKIAISALEKLKRFIDNNIEIENDISALKLQEFYDNQIIELKGRKNE